MAAQVAVLGAAISYAFAGVFGRRFKVLGIAPMVTATGQVTASSAMLPLAVLVDHPWALPVPSVATIAAMLALALVSTAFAYFLFFRLLSSAGATNTALVTFLIPIAVLFGDMLGERLAPRHFAGMALIAGGLVLIDGRALTSLSRRVNGLPATPRGNG